MLSVLGSIRVPAVASLQVHAADGLVLVRPETLSAYVLGSVSGRRPAGFLQLIADTPPTYSRRTAYSRPFGYSHHPTPAHTHIPLGPTTDRNENRQTETQEPERYQLRR